MERSDHLRHLADDIAAVAVCASTGPLDAPVVGCPGWSLADLVIHLGDVQRWARTACITASPPREPDADPAPADHAELGEWFRRGGERLLVTLGELDPDGPTWHPFPVPRVAGVWPRRQAQEASVHRWDAETAAGRRPTIDATFAADGIDEYWRLAAPRLIARERLDPPAHVAGVTTLDTGHRWVVAPHDGAIVVLDDGAPEIELAGTAEHLLLALWRRPVPDGAITVGGNASAADGWLSLGGM